MGDTQSNYAALLKNVYPDDRVANLIYNKNRFLDMVEKDENFFGAAYPHVTVFGGAQGVGSDFASAQRRSKTTSTQAAQFNINSRGKVFGLARWDRELMLASQPNEGAFISAAKLNIENVTRFIGNDLSDALYKNGYGDIGQVGSTTNLGSTVLQLAVPQDAVRFEVGMELDVASTQTATVRAYGTSGNPLSIVKIDRDAGTLTLNANLNDATNGIPTIAAGDFLFRAGDHSTVTTLPIGLEGWIPANAVSSADSFWGVNRSVDSRLYGARFSATDGRPLEDVLIDAAFKASLNDGQVDTFLMSLGNYAKLHKQLGTKVRYVDVKGDAGVGFQGIEVITPYGNAVCVGDRSCPTTRIYGLEMKSWKLCSLGKLVTLVDEDGLTFRAVPDASAFETRYESYSQLVCTAPSHNVNIQVPAF